MRSITKKSLVRVDCRITVVVATNFLGGDETGRAGAGNTELAEPGESRARARR